MLIALVVIALVLLLGAFFVVGFNRLRTQDVKVNEALGGIDVQLTRRADLIPNLVNTVKGYAQHESGVFEAVTQARAGVQKAAESGTVAEKSAGPRKTMSTPGTWHSSSMRSPPLTDSTIGTTRTFSSASATWGAMAWPQAVARSVISAASRMLGSR